MYSPHRKRITLMPAVALAALSALVAIPALSQSHLYAAGPQRFAHVTVQSGDSLWTIADRYTVDGGSVQDTIDRISAANNLTDSTIVPGQRLTVPR